MRITINTGTDHELYNCHMRACMLFKSPHALVEIQKTGPDAEVWVWLPDGKFYDAMRPYVRDEVIKAFNKAEACNPYAVEAFGKHTGGIK